jgi:hypothetical protein
VGLRKGEWNLQAGPQGRLMRRVTPCERCVNQAD